LIDLAFLEKDDAEVCMSHPALRVSCKSNVPEPFDVAIHRSLPPRQCRQHRNCKYCRAPNKDTLFKRVGQTDYPRRGKGDRPDTRQILVVIRHKGITECEEHDEPKHWTKCRDKECSSDLDAASRIAPQPADRHTDRDCGH